MSAPGRNRTSRSSAAAAEAGARGILCEKPLALSIDDLEAMTAACTRHGVKLAGGHQYRFQPTFVAAAGAIRAGQLGRVRRVVGCIQGSLANNGPHLIDTIRYLLGDAAVERVSCTCRREMGGFNRAIPAEEAASGAIEFAGGVRAEITTGEDAPAFFRITVEGEKGSHRSHAGRPPCDGLSASPRRRLRCPPATIQSIPPMGQGPAVVLHR